MRKIWVLMVLAGCGTYPQVHWPAGDPGPAPALLPLEALAAEPPEDRDAAGAALASRAAGLQARVAEGP